MNIFVSAAALLLSLLLGTAVAAQVGPTFNVCGGATNTYTVPPQTPTLLGSFNTTGANIDLQCIFAATQNRVLVDVSLVCSPGEKLGPFVTLAYFKDSHYIAANVGSYTCPFGRNSVWSLAAFNPYVGEQLNVVSVASAAISGSAAAFIPANKNTNNNDKNDSDNDNDNNKRRNGLVRLEPSNRAAMSICGKTAELSRNNTQNGFARHVWNWISTDLTITCFGAFTSPAATLPLAVDVMVACSTDLNFENNRVILGTFNTAFNPVANAKFTCPFSGFFAILWLNKARASVDMYIQVDGQVS